MRFTWAVMCAAGAAAALVVGFTGADAHGKARSPAHHRPPKLQAGEEWSFVVWELKTDERGCDHKFGFVGIQTCDGVYETNNFPRPEFGGWGFLGRHNGTSKAAHQKGEELMRVDFYTPGAEIKGTIPSESSNRYTVTSSQGPGGWRIESPADAPDYATTKEGEKGGPLHINVESAGRTVLAYGYHLRVHGWVVVVKHARR